jgi:hypothetical protein
MVASMYKRRVAVDPSGNVWTVSPTEYLIEKRDSSLALARTFKRDLPKFRAREPYEWDPGIGSPVITHMYTASNRHLFVVVLLPTQVLPIGSSLPLSDWADWIVDVYDIRDGRFLASRRFDGPDDVPIGSLGDGRLYSIRTLGDGTNTAQLITYEVR